MQHLGWKDKIGILDPLGDYNNPLTDKPYTEKYRELAVKWSKFPAYQVAQTIIESVEKYPLTLLVSATGSGKSVLVPKLVMHYLGYRGRIAMTLPKRIIVRSAATFAAATLDVELGHEIGYVYRGKSVQSPENRIVYMTDGYLLAKYMQDPLLQDYDAIIIDEAHERTVRIDLLLMAIREILSSGKRPDLRVIIMSATIDVAKYVSYYDGISVNVVEVAGEPHYPIDVKYLETPTRSYLKTGVEIIERITNDRTLRDEGIMFFVATSGETRQLCQTFRKNDSSNYCVEVYADMDQSLKIYAESNDRYRELGNYRNKLVMATNVAESSLTIEGLGIVIDSGYELSSSFNPDVYGQVLTKQKISRAQALQRRGRVGRTAPGTCYELLTLQEFNGLREYPVPDILREDVTMTLLQVTRVQPSHLLSDGIKIMNSLMDSPSKSHISAAKRIYDMYQLFDDNNKMNRIALEITQFSALPINQALFLIYAYQLGCAWEASVIVAMIETTGGSFESIFDAHKSNNSQKSVIRTLSSRRGDHASYLHIYQKYQSVKDPEKWADQHNIRIDVLKRAKQTANRYYQRIIATSRAPQLSRITRTITDVFEAVRRALVLSHRHLTAKNLTTIGNIQSTKGHVSDTSTVKYHYSKQELARKKFIYDEIVNINGSWEFHTITMI